METPMSFNFRFDPIELPPEAKELRREVRAFLREEIEAGTFSPYGGKGSFSREFTRKVGAKGWIGMTWPRKYGGPQRAPLLTSFVTQQRPAARPPPRGPSPTQQHRPPRLLP